MRSDKGIDTGDIIEQKSIDIFENETCGELFERLSVLGSSMIVPNLYNVYNGNAKFIKQDDSLATLTKIIKKEDAIIDFNQDANSVVNHIRAFNPSPTAYTFLNGEPFKVYSAKAVEISGGVGEVLENDNQLVIGCKTGAVSLLTVQKAGGKAMDIKDFLRGTKLPLNSILK